MSTADDAWQEFIKGNEGDGRTNCENCWWAKWLRDRADRVDAEDGEN